MPAGSMNRLPLRERACFWTSANGPRGAWNLLTKESCHKEQLLLQRWRSEASADESRRSGLSNSAAAAQQEQAVAAGPHAQHRLEVQRLGLMLVPRALAQDDVAGRRVAELASDSRRVAVEIEQQGRRIVSEAVQIERFVGAHRAIDLACGRTKRTAVACGGLVARQIDEIEDHQPRRRHRESGLNRASDWAARGERARSPGQQKVEGGLQGQQIS